MTITTLHYLFSSIPQILGATSAILIAVMFFRIEKVSRCFIGDGKAILRRASKNDPGYQVLKGLRYQRLEDAIDRQSIPEIKEIIKFLNDSEIKAGITKTQRPKGFQFIYGDRFLPTEKYLNNLKSFTIFVIIVKVLTIVLSIVFLSLTDIIFKSKCMGFYTASIVILFVLSLSLSIGLIIYSLKSRTIYEDLELRDEVISDNMLNNN
jgi:hypothetical protein